MFERNHISLAQLPQTATELITGFTNSRIFAFYGEMGSGKTTFIQEICRFLNSTDVVTSPTFAIINEYFTNLGTAIYHFDFYRLRSISEAFDLGYEDYLYSGNYCLIEWPEKIESLLPEDHVKVTISREEGELRKILAVHMASEF